MSGTRKQLRTLYVNSALDAFRIAGASWAALLYVRGFSLVEIGFAESVFHLTGLLCEVPSGALSDVFGRKRSMVLSQCMAVLSALAMLGSRSLPGVCLAMALSALGYSLASGTREALAYDTLKENGEESGYDVFSSAETVIFRLSRSAATLCAGAALAMGYRMAYSTDALLGVACLMSALRLREPESGEETASMGILACLRESGAFLRENRRAALLIFFNAAIGAAATLLTFFLQAVLPEHGLPDSALGPSLFLMGLGGAVGARAVLPVRHWSYPRILALSALTVGACLLLTLTGIVPVMVACGFCASLADDFLQVRSDVELNGMIPSARRATLLSVSSLCFSLVMIVLSPVLGAVFS